jgi:HCOMODA/2-hydroxy-3-carboxy-muconic semialdehyde decarboxylase
MLITTQEEGKRIAQHLGQYRVHLLRGHGCNIVGETIPHLVASALYLRDNATVQWQTLLLGAEITYLSPEEAKRAMEVLFFNPLPLERMWGYWLARVRRNMPDIE